MIGDTLASAHTSGGDTTIKACWKNGHEGDGIRFVVNGKVLREQIVGPSGELTWRLAPGQATWCAVELRDSDEGLWAVTNPIFFG